MSEVLTERFEMRLSKKHEARIKILCLYKNYKHKADLIRHLIDKEFNKTLMIEGVEDAGKQ